MRISKILLAILGPFLFDVFVIFSLILGIFLIIRLF